MCFFISKLSKEKKRSEVNSKNLHLIFHYEIQKDTDEHERGHHYAEHFKSGQINNPVHC